MPNNSFIDYSGQSIDGYQVDKQLVRHKMTAFYLARDSSGTPVFIEILNRSSEQDPELDGRVQKRLHTLMQFHHAGIASILYAGHTENGHAYAISQYIVGDTLAKKLDEWDRAGTILSVLSVLQLIKSMAQAFAVIHPLDIFHFDLRPDNIILDENNQLVLIGLGTPYQAEETSPPNQVSLLDYASPEQQQGKSIDGRSNIFSLGVILYKLLTGYQPEIPLYPLHTSEIATLPKEVPLNKNRLGLQAETYKLVDTCLERQAGNRYATIDQFISAVDDAIAAETDRTRNAQFSRWLYVAIPLGLLLIALAGFLLVRGNSETNAPAPSPEVVVPTISPLFQTQQPDQVATPTPTTEPQILLLNPASGLIFTSDETINFDWSYPIPLTSGQQFLLQITTKTGTQTLGAVTTPLSGLQYRLAVDLSDWESISGIHQWFVVLEAISDGEELLHSDLQPFTVQAAALAPTMTSTHTPTPSPTPTPEISTAQPTPTPTAVCTPAPPSGWVSYTVQEGDYLFNLALDTRTTVARLQEVNCLTETGLGVGQRLWLPAISPTHTPSSIPAAIPTTASSDNG